MLMIENYYLIKIKFRSVIKKILKEEDNKTGNKDKFKIKDFYY